MRLCDWAFRCSSPRRRSPPRHHTLVQHAGNARAIEQALLVLNWICAESNELALKAIKLQAFDLCEALVNDDNCKIAKNAVELVRTLEKA